MPTTPSPAFETPHLGIQGPTVAWQDPWSGPVSEQIMRTGTGVLVASQDPPMAPAAFIKALLDLKADFYLHHVPPCLEGVSEMLRDVAGAGIDIALGTEYGNINGPHADGTNRFDLPDALIDEAAATGHLAAVLYDEPEHLQINATQYRHGDHLPHFAMTDGLEPAAAEAAVTAGAARVVERIQTSAAQRLPVVSEHVFPTMFHTLARAGMTPCPKVMKESFQPLQLGTALGAALQYGQDLWICADLWGPDIGPWFTRAPGFPGHSPEEYASALRMAYLFAPSHLFTENVDALLHHGPDGFTTTAFGEVWMDFVQSFIPQHPLTWRARDATPRTVLIHAEDSNYGTGAQPFGNRTATAPEHSWSVFDAWHLLSHGSIPREGSCMHAPGFSAPPRCRLDDVPRSAFPLESGVAPGEPRTPTHGLFHPVNDVVAFDESVNADTLGDPDLVIVAGSRLPDSTRELVRRRAAEGATVVIPAWLAGQWQRTERHGTGLWVTAEEYVDDPDVRDAIAPHLGSPDTWTQRFGKTEIRFTPADDAGLTVDAEIAQG